MAILALVVETRALGEEEALARHQPLHQGVGREVVATFRRQAALSALFHCPHVANLLDQSGWTAQAGDVVLKGKILHLPLRVGKILFS